MRKRSPRWMACVSDSGALRVSPRLRSVYVRAVEILEVCAACLFDAIVDLLAIDELVEAPCERVGRA